MKWKDLSLKERKQIYDSVRVNNPGATYFDIKQQFDSIPAYQDGKGKTINKADLPPEYRTGTPEYFERQRKISGAVNAVQPEAYITPAGYINDYSVILDNNIYMPGTANHELGHVADGLAGSRKIQDFDSGKEYITNTYLNYLANSNNTYSSAE